MLALAMTAGVPWPLLLLRGGAISRSSARALIVFCSTAPLREAVGKSFPGPVPRFADTLLGKIGALQHT
jgi:hypothetical protein